jgi:hypothetical protein
MTAPIAIELVADPAPDAQAARALLDACSDAAGPGGCVLDAPGDRSTPARARVVVVFLEGDVRLRVELVAPPSAAGVSRQAAFRPEDPVQERFRAAGLIAAGLVVGSDLTGDRPISGTTDRATEAEMPAPAAPKRASAVMMASGGAGFTAQRSWGFIQLGADLAVAGPVTVALSGGYGHTWTRDSDGIAEQRATFGIGAGLAQPLGHRLELRARVGPQVQQLRADVVQPVTGREDEGGRTLVGVGAEADLAFLLAPGATVFAGDRLDLWGGSTTVNVAGAPKEAIGSWFDAVTLGIDLRFP